MPNPGIFFISFILMKKENDGYLNLMKRPFNLFLVLGLIFLCEISLLRFQEMDFHFNDNYFVISSTLLPVIALFTSILIWLVYFLTRRHLGNKGVIWNHVAITGFFLVLLGLAPIIYNQTSAGFAGMPKIYDDYWTIERYKDLRYFGNLILIVFLAIVFTQLLFVLIFGIRYFKKWRL
jgi:heme/copper-type cytochrome/quinol oxidase subunit 1